MIRVYEDTEFTHDDIVEMRLKDEVCHFVLEEEYSHFSELSVLNILSNIGIVKFHGPKVVNLKNGVFAEEVEFYSLVTIYIHNIDLDVVVKYNVGDVDSIMYGFHVKNEK